MKSKVLKEIPKEVEETTFYCTECNQRIKFGVEHCPKCNAKQLWALFG